MFYFGIYTLKARSFDPRALGYQDIPDNVKDFHVGQKCVHFLFIPLFPLEKYLFAYGRDGKKYPVPPKFSGIMQREIRNTRTPFYAWTGVAVIIGLVGWEVFKMYYWGIQPF